MVNLFLILIAFVVINTNALAEPEFSEKQINAYLLSKSCPMTDMGKDQIANSILHKVDPRLVYAIAGAETTFGKKVCVDNNAWNWFHGGSCKDSPFESWKKGAQTVTKFLRKSYLDQGLNTIKLIGAKYCAAGCENWEPLVMRFYKDEQGGSISDLGYKH